MHLFFLYISVRFINLHLQSSLSPSRHGIFCKPQTSGPGHCPSPSSPHRPCLCLVEFHRSAVIQGDSRFSISSFSSIMLVGVRSGHSSCECDSRPLPLPQSATTVSRIISEGHWGCFHFRVSINKVAVDSDQ